uniref:Uncharacterized protein n=1 Tax=Coccolithus braarudii TaxID=221442 RepID=A0A7S0L8V4_9EUKA
MQEMGKCRCLALLLCASAAAAYHLAGIQAGLRLNNQRITAPIFLSAAEDDSQAAGDEPSALGNEDSGEIEAYRAKLMRQFGMGADADTPASPAASEETVELSDVPATGLLLVANPRKFCSRNPFARPVRDIQRFGLQGPVSGDELSPDLKAQMLPVLLITEHGDGGSKALLLERRTGALMGDISMDDFGCVAIAPLWLGGTGRQSSLYVLHTVEDLAGATPVAEGIWLGGWDAARPKVADSSLAESRFKFFLGVTEWEGGQLQQEIDSGAWLMLKCPPELVFKDRVMGWKPGQPKPVWTELVQLLGETCSPYLDEIYPQRG